MSAPTGPALAAYLGAMRALAPFAPALLRRRLKAGKEDPDRIGEKLGRPALARPAGRLVWLHAVGLGEVMALRGLIGAMATSAPDLSFLVTSTARSSAGVFAANIPPRTQHQFLPLDAPRFYGPFLDHWRPDLSVWSEQDLWPGLVCAAHRRGIPLALINVRLNQRSGRARGRVPGLYRDTYARFSLIGAQDETSARMLKALGAPGPVLRHPSLKVGAPALAADPAALAEFRVATEGRRIWCLASSHAEDEGVALAAHSALLRDDPAALLVIAPRIPARRGAITAAIREAGLSASLRSADGLPGARSQVYVADTFGEMGLWYRLASTVLMGGTFGPVEGHNPWEPARLGAVILHGPRVANFAADYARLDDEGAALEVQNAEAVTAALRRNDLAAMAERARAITENAGAATYDLAERLVALLPVVAGADG
ncbi:MAG: glycosyltransferase N-terminal domain-containing protein [Paracoccaceae bacterium]